jgi:thiol-disulfide isomerase/thioredoxin
MSSARAWIALPTILISVLSLTACNRGDTQSTDRPAASATSTGDTPPITEVTPAELMSEVRRPGAKATLVNVWASWCAPCRAEFPELLKLERDYRPRGLRTVLVSVDFEGADARSFLASQNVEFQSYLKTGDDTEFINGLSPKWSGALPATFMYDSAGALISFWEGRADYQKFEQATLEALHSTGPTP